MLIEGVVLIVILDYVCFGIGYDVGNCGFTYQLAF